MRFTYATKLNLQTTHGKRYEHLTGASNWLRHLSGGFALLMAGAAVVGAAVRMGVIAVTGCFADLGKSSCKQSLNRSVGRACGACIHLDACLAERVDCAPTDAATNEYVNAALRKQSGKCAMASTVAADDLRCDDFPAFDFVDFELLRVAEMLEDFSVGVGGCDFHSALLVCFAVEMGTWSVLFARAQHMSLIHFNPYFLIVIGYMLWRE